MAATPEDNGLEAECATTPRRREADLHDAERPENPAYLSEQLITYIGNKRALLPFIGEGVETVKARLGKRRITAFDAFSGSGVVSRYLKRHCAALYANDLERYAEVINRCYLANREDFPEREFDERFGEMSRKLESGPLVEGIVSGLYAPRDDRAIKPGERAFYTARNARYIDTARALIDGEPEGLRDFFLAPLLSEASIHANTAGVFKGFYKNPATGLGQFGGRNADALSRIRGNIGIRKPVLSDHACECVVLAGDANEACARVPEVDLAYLDPPYNQHPYGSNYFMLNVICENRRPDSLSRVSGIPADWKRSDYNRREAARKALADLVARVNAKFVLVSFNSEGFIPRDGLLAILGEHGPVTALETPYSAFRGSRNLRGRSLRVREYLFVLEKRK